MHSQRPQSLKMQVFYLKQIPVDDAFEGKENMVSENSITLRNEHILEAEHYECATRISAGNIFDVLSITGAMTLRPTGKSQG